MQQPPSLGRLALELYVHGYYPSRDEALAAVVADPAHAHRLLALYHAGPEMHHADDRAPIDGPDGWGHFEPGAPA